MTLRNLLYENGGKKIHQKKGKRGKVIWNNQGSANFISDSQTVSLGQGREEQNLTILLAIVKNTKPSITLKKKEKSLSFCIISFYSGLPTQEKELPVTMPSCWL